MGKNEPFLLYSTNELCYIRRFFFRRERAVRRSVRFVSCRMCRRYSVSRIGDQVDDDARDDVVTEIYSGVPSRARLTRRRFSTAVCSGPATTSRSGSERGETMSRTKKSSFVTSSSSSSYSPCALSWLNIIMSYAWWRSMKISFCSMRLDGSDVKESSLWNHVLRVCEN